MRRKTVQKRFRSPTSPHSPRRNRGAGTRLALLCAITGLAMLMAGCTGLVPGLPI